jgi:CelD/BcsL family acetyltransferase involved in cellulose biosynthesis
MAASTAAGVGVPALRLEHGPGLAELRDTWSELAERSGNLFATWEWADAWWRHYGGGRPLRLCVCRDDAGAPVAILPLYEAFRRPARVLRLIGHGAGDELGPVGRPGEPGVAEALARAARELGADVLLADRLPAGRCPDPRGWAAVLGGVSLLHDSSPTVDVAGATWDGYLATRSSNFRSQVRRKERKLQREHGLTYRLSDAPDRLQRDLDALFALHRARWGEAGSGALEGSREAFHRDLAATALERGWLRLWLAEADERPVAAWYGFRYGGADWYYQLGRDPSWDASSVGLVLLAHTLREAIADGQREYKLLRGGEGYKDRFATSDPGLDTVAAGAGARGRLLIAAARAGLALPPPLRGRVTRAVG